jgi:hypothetical protein
VWRGRGRVFVRVRIGCIGSAVLILARVATVENESFLLNIAQYGTTQHVEKLVGARGFNGVNDSVAQSADALGLKSMSVICRSDPSVFSKR